jgi:hypothetical protein
MEEDRMTKAIVCAAAVAAALGAGAARADTMHPVLGARLAGMGEHGVVNFHSTAAAGKLCWTFQLGTKGVTRASIRDGAGMVVAKLGKAYTGKGCAKVPAKALRLLEAKPASYVVWVDTKGHPGDLRGKLFAGMAHM